MQHENTYNDALPRQRSAGVCLHLTSLPGRYGIGDLGDSAFAFVDAMADMQLRVWQFLPTGPTAYGNSPYQPLSTFAGNESLIDTGGLVREGLITSNEADSLIGLPSDAVDYGRLIPAKDALLKRAARRFIAMPNAERKADYDAFLDQNDQAWLHDYALFRILKSRHGEQAWTEWDAAYAQRDANALARLEADCADEIETIKIQQFLFFSQWQKLRAYAGERDVAMFGDMPICIALDSADAWANREIVCLDDDGQPTHVAGVPPDYFSEDGQLWGNPLYDWKRHAADGYRWWIERLGKSAELADMVRIDHFRGFEAYWSIPASEATARHGEWVTGPGDAIFVAFTEALGKLPIVAEDLGVITPEVEALRDRHHIPGMKVLQFEVSDDEFDITSIGENCVCYTGTHDNDTTLGWFEGSPGDIRSAEEIERTQCAALEVTGGQAESIHKDMIRLAFDSKAQLAIAPMQDFLGLGSEARFNIPGTSSDNWQWRLGTEDLSPALIDSIGQMASDSGRGRAH